MGFYLVGSVALGSYRRRRSDLDFVGVLDREVRETVCRSPAHCTCPEWSCDWVQGADRGPLAPDGHVERSFHL